MGKDQIKTQVALPSTSVGETNCNLQRFSGNARAGDSAFVGSHLSVRYDSKIAEEQNKW